MDMVAIMYRRLRKGMSPFSPDRQHIHHLISVPAAFYEEMLIPVPPIPVQQQVIDECAKIDEEFNTTRMSIETYRQKIADLFAELDVVMSTVGGQTEPV